LGFGVLGLGYGVLAPIPNPQSPIIRNKLKTNKS